jgi:hypothetical protein
MESGRTPMGVQVLEGRWEEILDRSQELAGRRVRVIVDPTESGDPEAELSDQELRARREAWVDAVLADEGIDDPDLEGWLKSFPAVTNKEADDFGRALEEHRRLRREARDRK